ncbi:MAG TPA: DUF5605 domain-containing protein [Phycisphaerae bacterium]|nr:DUF5605 domain-containing protein [Phycisphaerae bacterium]
MRTVARTIVVLGLALAPIGTFAQETQSAPQVVEQWGMFEKSFAGPREGNPFVDVELSASFERVDGSGKKVIVRGFYDGDGTYRIRFMPEEQGTWRYETTSNRPELNGKGGELSCGAPGAGNHGPVRVANVHHFAYADGTPFVAIGTTCYAWANQPENVEEMTLATLRQSPFNKVRMNVLEGNSNPLTYPYDQDANGRFDEMRFNPAFFQHFEKRVQDLQAIGIEAEPILFNPYKKGAMAWFDSLDNAGDDRYLRYVVRRLAAYHNVWWSLANEYGQVKGKTEADWDHFFQLVQAEDPYGHQRSIHNAAKFYDSNKPWVTHASIQNGSAVADFGRAVLYRELWPKPVMYDEICYEGNIDARWGQLTGEEMVKRFWLGTIAGTYVGHGETYSNPEKISWTSEGGILRGTSPARLAFLKKILESGPADGIEPIDEYYETHMGGKAGEYYLVYFGEERPTEWQFRLPRNPPAKKALTEGMRFHVDVLDTWNMTITPVEREFVTAKIAGSGFPVEGDGKITLPGRPYMALRIVRAR